MYNADELLAPTWDESTDVITVTSTVDTLSTTGNSFSTSHTVPGPGALSGKAILALGKATLRVAENLAIRRRLHALSSKFPHRDRDDIKGIEQMYEDVMELSRRDLYPNAVRTRAVQIILVQIGSREVEKLIQYLATWSSVELSLFITEITELFNPLRLLKDMGHLSILMEAYRNSLIREDHHLGPLIFFFHRLARVSNRANAIILESGVIELLAYLDLSGYFDPLVPTGAKVLSEGRSVLRASCEDLLMTCSSTRRGRDIIRKNKLCPLLPPVNTLDSILSRQARGAEAWRSLETGNIERELKPINKHPFHIVWPMLLISPFSKIVSVQPAERAAIWRSAKPRIIDLRLSSILDVIRVKPVYLLEPRSLADIAGDALEFFGHDHYGDTVKARAFDIILVLIGSRRTEGLVDCLTTMHRAQIKLFISGIGEIFNPLRLYAMKQADTLPISIQIYKQSLSTSETHSFQPLVAFFENLAAIGRPEPLQGVAIEFLLYLYLSDFFDPLFSAENSENITSRLTVRAPYNSRLLEHVNSRADLGSNLEDGPPNAIWRLQLPHVPNSEFPMRLAERARIWESMNAEAILFRINLIFSMVPSIWKEVIYYQNTSTHMLAIADLMEFLGSSSIVPEISFYALMCLGRLVSYSLLSGNIFQVLCCSMILKDSQRCTTLITHIFRQLSYWQQTLDTAAKEEISILRWKDNFPTFGTRGILKIIDFLVGAARNNSMFLKLILEANILGLLGPVLEQELHSDMPAIMNHDGKNPRTYDGTNPVILVAVGEHGPVCFQPDAREDADLGSLRWAVLSHAFKVLL